LYFISFIGNKEWNGAWSDGSEELIENLNNLNKYVRKVLKSGEKEFEYFEESANDGTFLMSFDDWW
jgi:hypothetical protein